MSNEQLRGGVIDLLDVLKTAIKGFNTNAQQQQDSSGGEDNKDTKGQTAAESSPVKVDTPPPQDAPPQQDPASHVQTNYGFANYRELAMAYSKISYPSFSDVWALSPTNLKTLAERSAEADRIRKLHDEVEVYHALFRPPMASDVSSALTMIVQTLLSGRNECAHTDLKFLYSPTWWIESVEGRVSIIAVIKDVLRKSRRSDTHMALLTTAAIEGVARFIGKSIVDHRDA